jgi:hypothetical protein
VPDGLVGGRAVDESGVAVGGCPVGVGFVLGRTGFAVRRWWCGYRICQDVVQGFQHLGVGAAHEAGGKLVQQAQHFVGGMHTGLALCSRGVAAQALQHHLQGVGEQRNLGAASAPGAAGQRARLLCGCGGRGCRFLPPTR